jgi:hypothetical protein
MIKIVISEETSTTDDMAFLLREIAKKLEAGVLSGVSPNFQVSGEEEIDPDNVDVIDYRDWDRDTFGVLIQQKVDYATRHAACLKYCEDHNIHYTVAESPGVYKYQAEAAKAGKTKVMIEKI